MKTETHLELGIATDFAGESIVPEKVREMLESVRQAGFTHVHWCHEWDGDYTYSVYEMQQIREWMDELGLKAKSFHATKGSVRTTVVRRVAGLRRDYTSCNEYSRLAGVELIRNRMQMAELLGAREIVLHLHLPYLDFREDPEQEALFYRQVYRSLDELREEAEQRNLKICLENLLETPAKEQIQMFDRLFARYGKEYLGLCLDTGHANIVFGSSWMEFAKRYADRLFSVHLHDNLGGPTDGVDGKEWYSWQCDLHMLPGEGTIDWEAAIDVLAGSVYELPLVMEVNCREKETQQWLKKAYQTGEMLTKQMEQRRE